MEPEFLLGAQELLSRFAIYGRYYERPICGVNEQLRDRLEIAPVEWSLHAILEHPPDLLVVMMNPGGSRPLNALWDADVNHGFASAQPDRTQYQVMRLMLIAKRYGMLWRHARILNLSDLRTPKSAEMVCKLNAYQADDSHSLFSVGRAKECSEHFKQESTPVLCGWGLNSAFLPLAKAALKAARLHPLLGISTDGNLYRHPLPQRHDLQIQWLVQVSKQVMDLKGKQAK